MRINPGQQISRKKLLMAYDCQNRRNCPSPIGGHSSPKAQTDPKTQPNAAVTRWGNEVSGVFSPVSR